jgi:hypothetical protein
MLGLSMLVSCLAVAFAAQVMKKVDYSQHSVFTVRNAMHLLEVLEERFDVFEHANNELHVFGRGADVAAFLSQNVDADDFEMQSYSVQDLIDDERARIEEYQRKPFEQQLNEWHEEYHPFDDIVNYYFTRCQSALSICTFVNSTGNLTWNGNRIAAAHLTIGSPTGKPVVYWEFNIHAREWITSASGQYIFDQILLRYAAGDAQVTRILTNTLLVFIPVVNPDGLEHTWTVDRMWRKNRRNNGGSYGVDLNRNFDAQWGGVGSSGTPSSDTYRGPSPASEPETQALNNYFLNLGNVVGAIDIHSYGQLILRPYTHIQSAPPDETAHKVIGDTMRDLIFPVHGKTYTSGRWYSTLYASSGVAQDWWYQKGAYGFTVELRPLGSFPGFELPPDEIIPQGEELMPAFLYFAEAVVADPLVKKN